MRTNIRLLAVAVLTAVLAVPLNAAAEGAGHEADDRAPMHRDHAEAQRGQRLDCKALAQREWTAVGCKWTVEKRPDFGAYRLMRQERGERRAQVVFETGDRNRTHTVDDSVQRERDYVYFLEVRDTHGNVIGLSNPVRVSTRTRTAPEPAPRPAMPSLPHAPALPGLPEAPSLPEPPGLPPLPERPPLPGL